MYSEKVTAAERDEESIQAMLGDTQFTMIEDSYGWKKYQAMIVNTSGRDFENFSLTINLVDVEGAILETTYASVANWSSEQKANFEFSTDKEFATTVLTSDYVV